LDNYPVSANSLGQYFRVNGSNLSQQYKNHLSGFKQWDQLQHAEQWILFPENVGSHLCLDEVALTDGELYTVLTNAKSKCQKGSLIAMVKGVKSDDVNKILIRIPEQQRKEVIEISIDMANSMEKIARDSFPHARVVTDRFHVAQLISEAVQEIRIKHRWEAIEKENKAIAKAKKKGEKYVAPCFENGDSHKQLLARSRYLLFKTQSKWTASQKIRSEILFREYPDLHEAYQISMMFRNIYETSKSKAEAQERFYHWQKKIKEKNFPSFLTASQSIENHQDTILNFFVNRTTNALAEAFNSKLKAFRSVFRGVTDVEFFLFRVSLIFA
jgi:transposase